MEIFQSIPTWTHIGYSDIRCPPSLLPYDHNENLLITQKEYIQKQVMMIRWVPPYIDEVKINTDGAVNVNKGLYGIGGLIRNYSGGFIVGFRCSLGNYPPTNSVVAELEAIKFGLWMAWENGFKKVVCEVDCQVAINFITNTKKNLSPLYVDLVTEIRELLSWDWLCSLVHTYREGNFCADALAKQGSYLEKGRCQISFLPPPSLMPLLHADACGVQYPRGFRS